jgi:hypothetical protein
VLGPVATFMCECRRVALGVAESFERRHLYDIGALGVIGAIAAMADLGAGRQFDALCDRQRRRVGPDRVMRGQVFALPGVEHGVALEERNRAFGFLAFILGAAADDAVGVDDQLAMLPLRTLPPSSPAWRKVNQYGEP